MWRPDSAYPNASQNSDKQNARIEHDKALNRVMMSVMQDDTVLLKQFMDNEGFKRWMTDTVFRLPHMDGRRSSQKDRDDPKNCIRSYV